MKKNRRRFNLIFILIFLCSKTPYATNQNIFSFISYYLFSKKNKEVFKKVFKFNSDEIDKPESSIKEGNTYLKNKNTNLNYFELVNNLNLEKSDEIIVGIAANTSVGEVRNLKTININAENLIGIGAYNGAKAINYGIVNGQNKSVGLHSLNNSTIINNGEINFNGGVAIYSNNSYSENGEKGSINVSNNGIGVLGINNSLVLNTGIINVGNNDTESIGIKVNNSQAINKGIINLKRWNSVGIVGEESIIQLNSGKILTTEDATVGIQSYGSEVLLDEQSKIELSGNNNRGIVATNKSKIINNGSIKISGENANAISPFSTDGGYGQYINNGLIEVKGKNAAGIKSNSDSIVENTGIINFQENNSVGIVAYNTFGTNSGVIQNIKGGENTVGYSMAAGTLLNEGEIIIENSNGAIGISSKSIDNNEWMYENYTNNIKNSGTIKVNGETIKNLIYNPSGTIIGESGDKFVEIITGATGIKAEKSLINNEGKIIVEGELATGGYLMSTIFTNEGFINVKGKNAIGINTGIKTSLVTLNDKIYKGPNGEIINGTNITELSTSNIYSTSVFNKNNINVSGNNSIGVKINGVKLQGEKIYSKFENQGSIIVNGQGDLYGIKGEYSLITNSNKITVNNSQFINGNTFGIYGDNSYIVNEETGVIEVNGMTAIGIKGVNNSYIENKGKIFLNTYGTKNASGISVDSTSVFINTGEIIIDNNKDILTSNNLNKTEESFLEEQKGSFSPIKLAVGSTFYNNGLLNYGNEVLNTNMLGEGKLILQENGKIKAKEILGDIYIDSKVTLGNLKDEYILKDSIDTESFKGTLVSSYLFDSSLNNEKDIKIKRKSFETITLNKNFGEYLENNYTEVKSENKIKFFDKLKLNSFSKVEYENYINKISGENFYSSVLSETFDTFYHIDTLLEDKLQNLNKSFNEEYIVGYDHLSGKRKGNFSQSGYNMKLETLILGKSYKINNHLKSGYIFTYSHLDSVYDENSNRNQHIFKISPFIEKNLENSYNYIGIASFGYNYGKNQRAIKEIDLQLDSKVKSFYLGLNNQITKKIKISSIELNPVFELNFKYLNQDRIMEKNDIFGITLDKKLLNLLEIGTGLDFSYSKNFSDQTTVNFEFGGRVYKNIFKKFEDYEASINSLNGKYKVEAYSNENIFSKINSKINLNKNNFDIYILFEKNFEKTNNWRTGIGINYRFNTLSDLNPMNIISNLEKESRINLRTKSYFEFDKSDLNNNSKKVIEKFSEEINKNNLKGKIKVEGYTDNIGKSSYNEKLSLERANRVAEELKKQVKSRDTEYEILGKGASNPIGDNGTEKGRAKNRRVEIEFQEK